MILRIVRLCWKFLMFLLYGIMPLNREMYPAQWDYQTTLPDNIRTAHGNG